MHPSAVGLLQVQALVHCNGGGAGSAVVAVATRERHVARVTSLPHHNAGPVSVCLLYECMSVYVSVCVYVCMCACVYVCMCACVYV
jgi:hypothetical protein